jgi:outer membrane protein, multidrug efflux system
MRLKVIKPLLVGIVWAGISLGSLAMAQDMASLKPYEGLWAELKDPAPEALARKLITQNADIRIMAARLAEVKALNIGVKSAQLPELDFNLLSSRGNNLAGATSTETYLKGELAARWEIDLFGRIKANVRASEASIAEQTALKSDVTYAVLSEMTQYIITYRKLITQNNFLNQSLEAQNQTISLLRSRQSGGVNEATRLELALALRAQTLSRQKLITAQQQTQLFQLERLTGLSLAEIQAILQTEHDLTEPQSAWVEAVPLERLKYRPDVRIALAQIIRTDASVNIAKAEQWPNLSLSAYLEAQDGSSGLRLSDNPVGSLAASLVTPIFNAGRLKSNLAAAKSRQAAAVVRYEQTLQIALSESQGALTDFERARLSRQDQEMAVTHYQETLKLAQSRNLAGYSSVIEVSEAQSRLYDSQLSAIEDIAAGHLSYVKFLRAVGPNGS